MLNEQPVRGKDPLGEATPEATKADAHALLYEPQANLPCDRVVRAEVVFPNTVAPPFCELPHERVHQRTLLLVDDEENILSALKRLFRRDGYRVLTASSGSEALGVLAKNPVAVILSDQRMPGMTGVDFLRQAKELYPRTVRMTLSGYTDLQSIIDAVNDGAVYKFLTKPWDDTKLRGHVELAFHQHELIEENLRLGGEIADINNELTRSNQRLERLIADEQERRCAMQTAAGTSRDLLDLVPMAIFGLGTDGMLAYANRDAIREWPVWAAALGGEPDPALHKLLTALDRDPATRTHKGISVNLEGRKVTAWSRTVLGLQAKLGTLLMLQVAHDEC